MGHDEVIYKLGKCDKCGRFLLYSLKVYAPSPIYDESELLEFAEKCKKIEQIRELPCVCGNIAKIIDQTDWFYYGFGIVELGNEERDKAVRTLLRKHNVKNVVKIREPTSAAKAAFMILTLLNNIERLKYAKRLEELELICPTCKTKYEVSRKWVFCKNCLEILIL